MMGGETMTGRYRFQQSHADRGYQLLIGLSFRLELADVGFSLLRHLEKRPAGTFAADRVGKTAALLDSGTHVGDRVIGHRMNITFG